MCFCVGASLWDFVRRPSTVMHDNCLFIQNVQLQEVEEAARKEVERLTEVNARLAGHQNTKQKIHHLQQLKRELLVVKREKEAATSKLNHATGASTIQ